MFIFSLSIQFNVRHYRHRCCVEVTYLVCLFGMLIEYLALLRCSVGLCESGDVGFAGSFDLEYFVGDPLRLTMCDC